MNFKFFEKVKKIVPFPGTNRRRKFVGFEPGVLNKMNSSVAIVHYLQSTTTDYENVIPDLVIETKTCYLVANFAHIQSLNSFMEENINNYIWLYEWKLEEDILFNRFSTIDDIPVDVPLTLRCTVKVN